ncbi:Thermostable beta-glucosidase B [Sphingomonas paucimobilis]|nr:Thermostable beta-glucosidase B [Sphingomonas paucimobilis]
MARSPLAGRAFEYFSEDPLLTGLAGAAWTRGLQSTGVGACVKHLVCNDSETDRDRMNVVVDERTLREIYLLVRAVCGGRGGGDVDRL